MYIWEGTHSFGTYPPIFFTVHCLILLIDFRFLCLSLPSWNANSRARTFGKESLPLLWSVISKKVFLRFYEPSTLRSAVLGNWPSNFNICYLRRDLNSRKNKWLRSTMKALHKIIIMFSSKTTNSYKDGNNYRSPLRFPRTSQLTFSPS
jgi:hypothetical protein